MTDPIEHRQIAIIGAGFGGIGLAIKLREAGFGDLVVMERADDLGGTWQANTYPGCACDVPSHLYSYSFAPNPGWSRTYGRQPEILEYIRSVAVKHGVDRDIRYNCEVLEARWDEQEALWRLDTAGGPLTADFLLSATGVFAEAKYPVLPGLENFEGTTFHSLHWDHDYDLAGKNVAVIGTGASAVQFIPEIQPKVVFLTVFQRSAPWIMPRLDRRTSSATQRLLRSVPLVGKAIRGAWYVAIEGFGSVGFIDNRFRHPYEAIGKLQLRRQVRDPQLRRKLTPDYMIGCKRAIFADAYLPALGRPNVDVVTDGIAEVRARSIVTRAGVEIPVDAIIYGTGFEPLAAAYDRIIGSEGVSVGEVMRKQRQSYLGAALAGFPNFFLTLGPFGAAGNQSAIFMIESQITYIVEALRRVRAVGAGRIEVRREAQDAFVAEMERRSADTVWLTGGCQSYYTTPDGHNSGLYPNWSFEYRRRTATFDHASYEVSHL
ncbi:NAD(P)/FAD-dependent oxidoreductase [Nocardia sp. NPDC050713]|uniref:flavin-containing monooxygenase n=1 Tax=Nocardia sp. NPDC050713 TaxID=3154511 RepID=UPI0033C1874C